MSVCSHGSQNKYYMYICTLHRGYIQLFIWINGYVRIIYAAMDICGESSNCVQAHVYKIYIVGFAEILSNSILY